MRDTWAPIKKTAWISLIFSCGISIYLELGMVYWFVPYAGKSTLDFFISFTPRSPVQFCFFCFLQT